jgi:hypothetical protein
MKGYRVHGLVVSRLAHQATAASQLEAVIGAEDEIFRRAASGEAGEFADEVSHFLVDEEGDSEFEQSTWYEHYLGRIRPMPPSSAKEFFASFYRAVALTVRLQRDAVEGHWHLLGMLDAIQKGLASDGEEGLHEADGLIRSTTSEMLLRAVAKGDLVGVQTAIQLGVVPERKHLFHAVYLAHKAINFSVSSGQQSRPEDRLMPMHVAAAMGAYAARMALDEIFREHPDLYLQGRPAFDAMIRLAAPEDPPLTAASAEPVSSMFYAANLEEGWVIDDPMDSAAEAEGKYRGLAFQPVRGGDLQSLIADRPGMRLVRAGRFDADEDRVKAQSPRP